MPIHLPKGLHRVSQAEFAAIAYKVMAVAFEIHNELGRLLSEEIYQSALASRLPGSEIEQRVTVSFDEFAKDFFLDLLVEGAAAFELKAVETLTDRHRSQLLNYLLLTELAHGKLANFRPDAIDHEFLNATQSRADRVQFEVVADRWMPIEVPDIRTWLTEALRDWGTGLDVLLYEEAVEHFHAKAQPVKGVAEVHLDGRPAGMLPVKFAAPNVALKVTVLSRDGCTTFEDHTRRLLAHTSLRAIQWINIYRSFVQFKTIRKE